MVYASPGSGLTSANKQKFGARTGKYKFGASVSKYKLGARVGKYKLGDRARTNAGGQAEDQGPGNANTLSNVTIHDRYITIHL